MTTENVNINNGKAVYDINVSESGDYLLEYGSNSGTVTDIQVTPLRINTMRELYDAIKGKSKIGTFTLAVLGENIYYKQVSTEYGNNIKLTVTYNGTTQTTTYSFEPDLLIPYSNNNNESHTFEVSVMDEQNQETFLSFTLLDSDIAEHSIRIISEPNGHTCSFDGGQSEFIDVEDLESGSVLL